jgi:hypothetical protein
MNPHSRIVIVIAFFCFHHSYGQRPPSPALEKGYENGEKGFFETISKNIHYPKEARENGLMGLSSFAFKVDCDKKPHSFKFKQSWDSKLRKRSNTH